MNITFHSIASQSVSLFKEKIVPFLTTQREKITIIVASALGCLALCLLYRCFKANFSASTVATWSFRRDSMNKMPEKIPEEYAWVLGTTNVKKFLSQFQNLKAISAVAKSAKTDSSDSLCVGDLVIHAQNFEQMKAIVSVVANDKDKVRVIFSALFAMSDDSLEERIQWVVKILSSDQLKSVLALAKRHKKENDFYQQELHEIAFHIDIPYRHR